MQNKKSLESYYSVLNAVRSSTMNSKYKCPSCNTINKQDAKYCIGCGEPLKNGDKSTIKLKNIPEKNQDEPPLTATDKHVKTSEPNSNETNE